MKTDRNIKNNYIVYNPKITGDNIRIYSYQNE